jgi:hypothetical protein
MNRVLGIDIGRVILDRRNKKTDPSFFEENYLQSTPHPDTFDQIRNLQMKYFKHDVHLISKCSRKIQDRTLSWLAHHNFCTITGIHRSQVHFCRAHPQKVEVCKKLGITHFIDDRLEILSYLIGLVPHLYLFSPQEKEVERYKKHIKSVVLVSDWNECVRNIAKTCSM